MRLLQLFFLALLPMAGCIPGKDNGDSSEWEMLNDDWARMALFSDDYIDVSLVKDVASIGRQIDIDYYHENNHITSSLLIDEVDGGLVFTYVHPDGFHWTAKVDDRGGLELIAIWSGGDRIYPYMSERQ